MEAEPPMVTPTSKRKEKLLVEEESESKQEEDVEVAIEEAICRVVRIEETRNNLRDLIASIVVVEPATTTHTQVVAQ